MTKLLSLLATLMLVPTLLYSQTTQERYRKYINEYKQLAVDCMRDYGIPASIKLAQGLVESDAGDSRLAKEANNHFGIKCKSTWRGETISHDDDAKGECFRKYPSSHQSYIDHSEFLSSSARYDALFDYDITDYKSWAKGLKSAGYATNPAYADMLIRVIETYELHNLDLGGDVGKSEEPAEQEAPKAQESTAVKVVAIAAPAQQPKPEENTTTTQSAKPKSYSGAKALPSDFAIYKVKPTTIYRNNNVAFVIAQKGDNFDSLAARTGKSKKALMNFNQMSYEPSQIEEGTIIYVAAKKSKAANGHISHSVGRGQTLHYVSQLYGVKIENLADLNNFDTNYTIKMGQRLRLR